MMMRLGSFWDRDEWLRESENIRAAVVKAQHIIKDKQEEREEKDAVTEVMLNKAEEPDEKDVVSNLKKSCQLWEQ